ncbi:uncharacterized protein LAESUDRAFT_660557, partial [Laetiporus sulphureus 93-53]
MHILLWILNSLSPLEIRSRLLNDLAFCQAMLDWLDSCHQGDYSTGSSNEIKESTDGRSTDFESDDCEGRSATCVLPLRPPVTSTEAEVNDTYRQVLRDADQVVYMSNRHQCRLQTNHSKGCRRSSDSLCRARFPRDMHPSTEVDIDTGAIHFKKSEPWINTFNPVMSYALRCNTDVTCLLSGTQVRAIIAYITDYITKSPLKTHSIFETVRTV